MLESFGAGTAVIVSPIEGFSYKGIYYEIPINKETNSGEIAMEIN